VAVRETGKERCVADVLVVEDDAQVRDILTTVLRDEGHRVLVAKDGLEAVDALLIASRPLVVLLDLMMPLLGGDAILHMLAEGDSPLTRHRYVLVTARALMLPPELPPLLKRLEIPVVAKPFDITTILTAVERATERLFAGVRR
jgi:chemosensory pili system protein ChpA (sensor histidine kinase/response regulator)